MAGTFLGALKKVTAENHTVADLQKLKNEVVDELCKAIRDIANSNEDFFIIKDYDNTLSVGAKIYLPTVEQEVDY